MKGISQRSRWTYNTLSTNGKAGKNRRLLNGYQNKEELLNRNLVTFFSFAVKRPPFQRFREGS